MCVYQMVLFVTLLRGAFKISRLEKQTNLKQLFPSLSIVVPARNEAGTIEVGLSSLVKLDYPGLEIIVVNDRSTDGTLEKVEALQKKWPQIRVKNILCLPNGWLGKNYALHQGAQESKSDLILFTDADVEISTGFLKRAIQFLEKEQLDHLGGIPKVISRNWYLYPLVGVFGLGFTIFTRPWEGRNPRKDRAVGIGAFNLVKRRSYEMVLGHQTLSMRPDDDLKLALVFKRAGLHTDCVNGVDGMQVEWYPDFLSLLRGLEKNVMTGFEYQFALAVLSLLLYAGTFILPFVLILFTQGISLVIAALSILFLLSSFTVQLYLAQLPLWCVLFMPIATPTIFYIFARACLLTFIRQGVYWRDTFYSLESLRSNQMPLPGTLSFRKTNGTKGK
jgi:glycosyltransferase involved in cell wall biosynthesis